MAEIFGSLFNQFVHIFLEFHQLLGKGGVQRNHGTGAVGFGTHGAELEAVAGEGERAGAVAVGIVYHQFRNLRDVQLHALLAAEADEIVLGALFDVFQHLAQLLAQEGRDDTGGASLAPSRWAFVALEMEAFSNPL